LSYVRRQEHFCLTCPIPNLDSQEPHNKLLLSHRKKPRCWDASAVAPAPQSKALGQKQLPAYSKARISTWLRARSRTGRMLVPTPLEVKMTFPPSRYRPHRASGGASVGAQTMPRKGICTWPQWV